MAGAFRDVNNAERSVMQLQKQGYTARILKKTLTGYMKLSITALLMKREAINELHKIVRTQNESAWLLVMEE